MTHLEGAGAAKGVGVKLVHKKISLKDDFLAWEHERVSIRRLPGFTLSALPNHKVLTSRNVRKLGFQCCNVCFHV